MLSLRSSYRVLASLLLLICRLSTGSCQCSRVNVTQCTKSEYPATSLYSLKISQYQYSVDTSLKIKVYMTTCPGIDTPGPSWYKLEAIVDATGQRVGDFEKPHHQEAFRVEEGQNVTIEFETRNPVAILDLPRTYTWKSAVNYGKICFKLTLLEGRNNCTQVKRCIESVGGTEGSGSDEDILQPSTEASMTEERPTKKPCQRNCEGKPEGPFCVTPYDGRIFKTRCDFQVHKCLLRRQGENVEHLEVVPCSKIPLTTQPPTTASHTVPQPPTTQPRDSNCFRDQKHAEKNGLRWSPKCTCSGEYKLLQCDPAYTECWCGKPDSGTLVANYFNSQCTDDPENFDLSSQCFFLLNKK